jgi:hypothetical protein
VKLAGLWLLGVTVALACSQPLPPGQFGEFRLAGRAKGAVPLNLLPPATDRAGNVYILYGGIKIPEVAVFIGKNGGGWTSGCALTKGDLFGAHGWVGYDEDHQWYWSGDALVSVSGRTGDCHRVLDHDSVTDSNLLFRAVMPWVRDAPSRRTLLALVQSPVDSLPYSTRVDLDAEILTNVNAFDPPDAQNLQVLGVGADRLLAQGVVLLQYGLGDRLHTEGRFYDADATLIAVVELPMDAAPSAYSVLGYLQMSATGLVAGLLSTGSIVVFDQTGGKVTAVDSMTPVGMHRWGDDLFLVGTSNGKPVIAKLDGSGALEPPQEWSASESAASALGGSVTVRDDRALPAEETTWNPVRTAMGDFPFLSPHALTPHAPSETLWLIAGPSFDTGGAKITAFAMAPVGVSYP